MKKLVFITMLILILSVAISPQSAKAVGTNRYVDSGGSCATNTPCTTTIQAAINAASDGDTILVYPGTYDPQVNIAVPGWGGTYPAQGIVVWKADLTIKAVDPDPTKTVIENSLGAWMDWWRIQHITGGAWTGTGTTQTGGFNPGTSASPNALMIVKSGVTIEGFTFHAHVFAPSGGYNAAGVLIGGVAPGDPNSLGADNNVVQNNVFSDVWHAVYIWHSSGNQILNNTVVALGNTGHWAGISIYDGYSNAQIALGHLSENNLIAFNTLADKGISVGAYAPTTWTSAAGDVIACNKTTQVGVAYAHGLVLAGGNTGSFWQEATDNALNITGISYTGDMGVFPSGTSINLEAQLTYTGSGDGSGVEVTFTRDGTAFATSTTAVEGVASATATLPVGVYEVGASATLCTGCAVTSTTQFLVIFDATAGFVTGGGWIDSPAGAYVADPSLAGKANFGFVSKYKKGANVPDGNTEFQFKAGDLNFSSTSYQWLVVAGTKAQFKGEGTINGAGDYGFMLTATDGTLDKFRIKIWDIATGDVIYDNMLGVADGDNPTTVLGGGSIVIHK